MPRLLLVLAALLSSLSPFAQNLVPNPSFEEYLECPDGFPDLDGKCQDWMTFRITPDYFHNCSPTTGWDSWHGYQQSHSGMAHAGLSTYQTTLPNIANEHIGVELLSPLIVGEEYFVSFFVSMAYEPVALNVATNKIGALFTTSPYNQNDPFSPTFPVPANNAHIYTEEIIADSISWVKVSGSFTADSAYRYLVIGNFFEDSNLDTLQFENVWGPFTSYYYLDDVCVTTDSLYNEEWPGILSLNENELSPAITCYPNPASEYLNITSKDQITSIDMFNYLGQTVLHINEVNDYTVTFPVVHYRTGVYILKTETGGKSVITKLIIK